MNNRLIHTLGGLFIGAMIPLFIGSLIALIQGVTVDNFLWTLIHRNGFYNTYFQLGIAVNIGIFFLIMKRDSMIYFGRGWLVATVLLMLWTLIIELNWSL